MEEQQIRDFVHRVATEKALRTELENNTQEVIARENFSPRVAHVILRLVPHLMFENTDTKMGQLSWWH